jgi:protein SMG6
MKKSSAAVASKVPLSADPNEHQTIKSRAKHHLMKLVTAFQGFLAKSVGGFEELLMGLQARLIPGATDERDTYQCIFKCLLFLGDLARYRELHSEGSTKDWSSVENYYRRAFTVMPHFGNPHNQLAVVATYAESEFIAVYQYCRSVLVEHPFSVGVQNLKLAYEKILKSYPTCLQQSAISAGKQGFTKAVFVKFLFFQASLFIHSLRAVPSSSKFAGMKISDSITVPSLDDLSSQLSDILSEFDELLTQYKLSDSLLLKMLVVGIFSVHFGSSGQLYLDSMEYSASFHTHTESLAISLLLGLVTKIGIFKNLIL